jgi:hypothetical protein
MKEKDEDRLGAYLLATQVIDVFIVFLLISQVFAIIFTDFFTEGISFIYITLIIILFKISLESHLNNKKGVMVGSIWMGYQLIFFLAMYFLFR